MGHPVRRRPHPAVLIAIALPLLLAVALAAVAVAARLGWIGGPPAPDASPLAVVPVDAPAATDPGCAALLAALPAELDADAGPLPTRPLVEPAPPGVRAWAATPRPVVLRCGLPRPVELTPTAALLEINGVRWLAAGGPRRPGGQLRGGGPVGLRRVHHSRRTGQRADPAGGGRDPGDPAGGPGRRALTRNETRLAPLVRRAYIRSSW